MRRIFVTELKHSAAATCADCRGWPRRAGLACIELDGRSRRRCSPLDLRHRGSRACRYLGSTGAGHAVIRLPSATGHCFMSDLRLAVRRLDHQQISHSAVPTPERGFSRPCPSCGDLDDYGEDGQEDGHEGECPSEFVHDAVNQAGHGGCVAFQKPGRCRAAIRSTTELVCHPAGLKRKRLDGPRVCDLLPPAGSQHESGAPTRPSRPRAPGMQFIPPPWFLTWAAATTDVLRPHVRVSTRCGPA
jgi:hypothetical protein